MFQPPLTLNLHHQAPAVLSFRIPEPLAQDHIQLACYCARHQAFAAETASPYVHARRDDVISEALRRRDILWVFRHAADEVVDFLSTPIVGAANLYHYPGHAIGAHEEVFEIGSVARHRRLLEGGFRLYEIGFAIHLMRHLMRGSAHPVYCDIYVENDAVPRYVEEAGWQRFTPHPELLAGKHQTVEKAHDVAPEKDHKYFYIAPPRAFVAAASLLVSLRDKVVTNYKGTSLKMDLEGVGLDWDQVEKLAQQDCPEQDFVTQGTVAFEKLHRAQKDLILGMRKPQQTERDTRKPSPPIPVWMRGQALAAMGAATP